MKSTHSESQRDFELLQRWRGGDRAAGDQIIRRHFPALRRFFVVRIADPETREELIQDTLTGLTVAKDNFQGLSSFTSFMFGIARNKLHDHLRERYRSGGSFDPLTESIEDIVGRSPSSYAALREDKQRLLAAMATLPLDDQLLLELRYWYELSGKEVANLFGISPDAARMRLHRTRLQLQERLGTATNGGGELDLERLEQRLRELGAEI